MSPENCWLENYFSFWKRSLFQGTCEFSRGPHSQKLVHCDLPPRNVSASMRFKIFRSWWWFSWWFIPWDRDQIPPKISNSTNGRPSHMGLQNPNVPHLVAGFGGWRLDLVDFVVKILQTSKFQYMTYRISRDLYSTWSIFVVEILTPCY